MPWEQPGITDLSSAELQELIAFFNRRTSGRIRREWRDRMNSLEITAYKAFVAHRKAFDTWDNGNIDKVWLDDDKNICIRYDNGKWWHYSVSKSGEWMWW